MDANIPSAFLNGLISVFTWPAFGLMVAGIVIGFIVGVLPGIGGTVTMAIMIPFTFGMKPVEAFAFLLGMATVSVSTGDITSVLFGVPGEACSAACVVDGHPMAKQGQAGRALGAVLMSSLIGAWIGAFVLAASIPIVRPLVLSFGAPEFFMLTILGITFLGTLSAAQPLKGLVSGGLGLMLAMVGVDPLLGVPRFTLGQLSLWDGIGLVPAMVGLFAIPEIVELALKGTSIAEQRIGKLGGARQGVTDTFQHLWLVIRCSVIGTFVGIMPALGAGVAQWMGYAHAVQTSRDKERFGKGAIEGVVGPASSTCAVMGGALIPTVGFGVPGSTFMAILLGAFLIHGLTPGPKMLTTNLDLTMSFVWILVVSNLITVAASFLFLEQLAKITLIRGGLLIPSIILLVYFGGFAEKNSMMDLVTVLVLGALGLVMVYLGWPRPPLVLGLVLGRLSESYLFISTDRYGTEWLGRPIVLVLIVLSLGAVLYSVLQTRKPSRPDLSREVAGEA